MGLVKDREKWLKFLDEVEEPNVSPLAVRPFFFVTLRKHPEAGDLLTALATQLVRGVDQYDRTLGGDGWFFDKEGSVETDAELKLRLVANTGGWEVFGRMDTIHQMLNDLATSARQELVATQDADLRARVAAELESPIPRSVAARLVPSARTVTP